MCSLLLLSHLSISQLSFFLFPCYCSPCPSRPPLTAYRAVRVLDHHLSRAEVTRASSLQRPTFRFSLRPHCQPTSRSRPVAHVYRRLASQLCRLSVCLSVPPPQPTRHHPSAQTAPFPRDPRASIQNLSNMGLVPGHGRHRSSTTGSEYCSLEFPRFLVFVRLLPHLPAPSASCSWISARFQLRGDLPG